MPSKNNPNMSGYFHVNFILSLISLLITQSAHHDRVFICERYWWYLFKYYVMLLIWSTGFVKSWENVLFKLENIGTCVIITWNYFPCLVLHKVLKSFHRLSARFSAVIIVDFYINDFIFALFICIKDGKAVNYNGSEIIGLIHLKYGKRTACRDNIFTVNVLFSREAGKRSTTGYYN